MKRLLFIIFLKCVFALELERPNITSVTALEPVGYFITWTVVTSFGSDPVLGYKIRLWEIEEDKQGYFKLVNGEQTPGLLLEDRPLQLVDKDNPPKGPYREVLINNVSTEKAKIYNIKYDQLYEIRILAHKKGKEGPISEPARVKIMKGDAYLVVVQKRPGEECAVSIATNVTISDEPYYHLETTYL